MIPGAKEPKCSLEPKNGHFDPMFWRLFFLVCKGRRITGREMKYVLWRFWLKKEDTEIAKFDGRRITKQAVNYVLQKAYKKISKGPIFVLLLFLLAEFL